MTNGCIVKHCTSPSGVISRKNPPIFFPRQNFPSGSNHSPGRQMLLIAPNQHFLGIKNLMWFYEI